jgi:hypothetical protein
VKGKPATLPNDKPILTNQRLRDASGNIVGTSHLTCFLYLLMRDHLPMGVVEQIAIDSQAAKGTTIEYTNGWLAQYAQDVAQRLGGGT